MIQIGTAAWSIPQQFRKEFGSAESILETYATRFTAVEINSSFYKNHQAKTYVRWAKTVPKNFKFSVKLSREFTHLKKLDLDLEAQENLHIVLNDYQGLCEKLGCLLIQLPPSLALDRKVAGKFFKSVRKSFAGKVAFEPRHASWRTDDGTKLLASFAVSRVWADPAAVVNPEFSALKAGDLAYHRLHGSPEIYKSDYEESKLDDISTMLSETAKQVGEVWCIFDNTTFGHATGNALTLTEKLSVKAATKKKKGRSDVDLS